MNSDTSFSNPSASIALITVSETAGCLRLSRSGLDKLRIKDSTFPKPLKDGSGRQARVYFVQAEVDAWLQAKLKARAE
jgi:prophage regulatory protein